MNLGRLERVELRTVWLSESAAFTPWLAREENLSVLAETLGTELELVGAERGVGPYRADIVCRDTLDDHLVLIENQLERTDHGHLGQLMTYAAGLDAATIVWIASRFTDEHRAALDWLNQITEARFRFFGLEVELWRIGQSEPAPRFNIVSKPNDWTKQAARRVERAAEGQTDRDALFLDYWAEFKAKAEREGAPLRIANPWERQWFPIAIGRSGAQLTASLRARDGEMSAELFIRSTGDKVWYRALHAEQPTIDAEFGSPLIWEELPNRKGSRIAAYGRGDPADRADWPRQHEWLLSNLVKLDRVFRRRVRALPSVREIEINAEMDAERV